MTITFIGCGNMAQAMIGGMIQSGFASAEDITATAKSVATRQKCAVTYGITMTADNAEAAKGAEVLILAVKPNVLSEVMKEIAPVLTSNQLILSVAAGRSLDFLATGLGADKKLVRVMPNTPAMVGEGMTVWTAGENVSEEEKALTQKLLSAFGLAKEIPESQMAACCAVSGCAPAYVYMFIEAMADAGVLEGMPRKMAYELAAQTVLGSAKMVLETGDHPGSLKDAVTSPGGSTIAGVRSLEENGFRGAVMDALIAAAEKSKNM